MEKILAKASVAESIISYADKVGALEIVFAMGKDVKQANRKFRFTVREHVVPVFVYLHNFVENLIKANAIVLQKGNNLIFCLDKMAKKELRVKWEYFSSKE